jgi:lactobin A/cerein 7B family class IIb bacteriocin
MSICAMEANRSLAGSEAKSEIRELNDAELDQVDGGLVVIAIIAVLIGLLTPA